MRIHLLVVFATLVFLAPALAAEDDPEVARWLRVMGTPEEERPFAALQALIRLGDRAGGPALRVLNNPNESVVRRWQAAKVLGGIRATAAVGDLTRALGDDSPGVRACAAEALGRIGDKRPLEALRKALPDEKNEMARGAIERAIAIIEGRTPPGPKPRPAPAAAKPDFFESRFDWAPSLEEGLARAKKSGRPLLTVVYGYQSAKPTPGRIDRSSIPYHVLLRGPFTDPHLTELLKTRFVLARARLHIHSFSADYPEPNPDPLAVVGARCRDVSPPALLVSNGDGKLLRSIAGLGTFDARSIHAALLGVVDPDRDPPVHALERWLDGDEDGAMVALESETIASRRHYLFAKILHARGDHAGLLKIYGIPARPATDGPHEIEYLLADSEIALGRWTDGRARLRKLSAEKPANVWTMKAASRLDPASPDLGQWESHSYPDRTRRSDGLPVVVVRARDWLDGHRQEDGSWNFGVDTSGSLNAIAVTAIVAGALGDARGVDRVIEYAKAPPATVSQVFSHTYALELVLDLLEKSPRDRRLRPAAQRLVDALRAHQYESGGWSYLTPEFGEARFGGRRPHSFNTAPVLSEMIRARKLGLKVPEDVISRATASLLAMRHESGAFMYAPPKGFQWMTRPRASIARDCCCEVALLDAGKGSVTAVVKAVERFHEHRLDLEIPRKLYASYFNTNGHGAYFFTFAYYYAAKALAHVPMPRRKEIAEDLIADLLRIVEPDGTWIDSHAYGKAYATGMALRALALLDAARR